MILLKRIGKIVSLIDYLNNEFKGANINVTFFFWIWCFFRLMFLANYKFLFSDKKWFRIVFTIVFLFDFSLLYFIILQFINCGVLHSYFLFMFILGAVLVDLIRKKICGKNM